jgi:hypothetical protein
VKRILHFNKTNIYYFEIRRHFFRTPILEQAYEMFFSIINNFQLLPNISETFIEISVVIIVLLIVEIFQEIKDDSLVF